MQPQMQATALQRGSSSISMALWRRQSVVRLLQRTRSYCTIPVRSDNLVLRRVPIFHGGQKFGHRCPKLIVPEDSRRRVVEELVLQLSRHSSTAEIFGEENLPRPVKQQDQITMGHVRDDSLREVQGLTNNYCPRPERGRSHNRRQPCQC